MAEGVDAQIEAQLKHATVDTARIDKIERMAQARATKAGLVATFTLTPACEILIDNIDQQGGELLATGMFLTVREAIDAAPEPK